MTDKERLDFLESQTLPARKIACRESVTGRGWRLHEISKREASNFEIEAFDTVREAIDHYAQKGEQG